MENSLDNAVEVLKQVVKSHESNNEFTHFGLHVASQLQALPLREALKLQSDLQALITTVRIKQLIQPSYEGSSNSTNDDCNPAHSHVHAMEITQPSTFSSSANEDFEIQGTVQNTEYEKHPQPSHVYTYFTSWPDLQDADQDQEL
ncbi:unnamed protein product [Diabrotica balteata]|uniref:Uncharacterized protein n=1 Tax=Diabrotica balteata TaxID=107213 RepID=A0A9N9TBD5_DIABA|nr:unnamed protein product [Diabrotica balteata]